jgi:hypothetical protein
MGEEVRHLPCNMPLSILELSGIAGGRFAARLGATAEIMIALAQVFGGSGVKRPIAPASASKASG